MRIAVGADHRGFAMKAHLQDTLAKHDGSSIEWVDVGCMNDQYCDYPIYAMEVAKLMRDGAVDHGILICATGIGMDITANRFSGIYAGLAWNSEVARLAREHDNVNVLVLPSDFVSNDQAVAMIQAWL